MITVFFKASLPMERALAAFIAKVEGVVVENFSGGFALRPPQVLYSFSAPQSKICSAVLAQQLSHPTLL